MKMDFDFLNIEYKCIVKNKQWVGNWVYICVMPTQITIVDSNISKNKIDIHIYNYITDR